ncbi:hypothetical protein LPTSP4_32530 [Leptospira ryugenii]|uniref:Uncharacterized protein n=1 Tax=Leptospira ryugenii TaxID=1917863 RepID=A0A2P2E4A3_9LEPT|nr:hypothetical protein [Leptospira ryugenii]GBF51715.1 hypothetical protein LPTSP4_32530 [Leptospira ryugenii]
MKLLIGLLFVLFSSQIVSETLQDRFSLNSDFNIRPSQYMTESPFLVDRNRLLYIGKTINIDVPSLHFYEFATKSKLTFSPPIREYFLSHKELIFPGVEALKENYLPVYISEFLFFDREDGLLGMIVEQSHYKLPEKKFYFVVWNLEEKDIEHFQEIDTRKNSDYDRYAVALPIAYDEEAKTAYFAYGVDASLKNKEVKDVNTKVFSYSARNLTLLYSYISHRFPYHAAYHSGVKKILIQTYAESHQKPAPDGILLDLDSLVATVIPVPFVSYGTTFSKSGDRLYLCSAENGNLWVLDTKTGKTFQTAKLGTLGHSLGFWKEGELVWVRNSGVFVYDPITLKQKKVIPLTKYFKGQINVAGSLLIPYQGLLVRNGFEGPDGAAGHLLLTAD